ncbi:hypothetical protein LT493_12065 [Streptomyces tricolor]|nr:hypothetical protein [Streptomyces tricolor]
MPSAQYDDVTVAQPLLYAVSHASGGWCSAGACVRRRSSEHSVGEFAAATLAGIFGFDDGIRLMREQVVHFADTPPGGMLAVAAGTEDVADLLGEEVHLAAVNAAASSLLAGGANPWTGRPRRLARTGRDLPPGAGQAGPPQPRGRRRPRTRDPARVPHRAAAAAGRPLLLRWYGRPAPREEALDPDFWAWQAARTVYFAPALTALLAAHDCLLLEAGRATASAGWPAAQPG